MSDSLQFLFNTFELSLGRIKIPVPYWEAIAIVVLLFLLVLTLAHVRKHYIDWSFKGGVVGIFFGFLLALFLEGFLIISGRTALTAFLGWKNPPKPIAHVLDSGKSKLIQVLGTQTQIPSAYATENSSVQSTLTSIQSLNPSDLKQVKDLLCK